MHSIRVRNSDTVILFSNAIMAEDRSGVQTRAMMEAQHTEEETQKQLDNQQEQIQRDKPIVIPEQATPNLDQQNPTMNPTVELHKTSHENILEFIRRHSVVGLDWYVPNLSNTCVRHLIRDRLPIDAGRGRILFTCPQLREYFTTSTFKLDLTTG